MNTINVTIDFTKGINKITGINLITGDYASTKMVFEFDRTDGTKVLEMKNPSGEVVYLGEIVNNEVLLARVENGLNYSIFETEGRYIYEVSLYNGDSKLTSVKGELPVAKEQVIIDGEVVEPYLPLFDELMQELDTAITQTNNLNIDGNKSGKITTITITYKDGTTKELQLEDGKSIEYNWQGTQLGIRQEGQSEYVYVDLKGEKGDAGSIKFIIVETLPSENIDESAIYLTPSENPDLKNYYDEWIWVTDRFEPLGETQIEVDLTDYVKNTDYATYVNGGVVKANSLYKFIVDGDGLPYADVVTYSNYNGMRNFAFISKGTLENVITGKGLTTKTYVDGLVGDINTAIDSINGEVI